jgi:hypothetical protein
MRRTLTVLALLLAIVAPSVAAVAIESDPVVTVTIAWAMPTPAGGWTAAPTAQTATWPQTLATGAQCGGWDQVDVYRGHQSVIDAILADGQLTKTGGVPEDSRVVQSWSYRAQPACVVVPPVEPPTDPPVEVQVTPPAATPASAVLHQPTFPG